MFVDGLLDASRKVSGQNFCMKMASGQDLIKPCNPFRPRVIVHGPRLITTPPYFLALAGATRPTVAANHALAAADRKGHVPF